MAELKNLRSFSLSTTTITTLVAFISILFTFFPSSDIHSQTRNVNVNLSLTVRDSVTNAPLEWVTASIIQLKGEERGEVFAYAISDSSGLITFNRLPFARYELSLQQMGYFMRVIPEIKFNVAEVLSGNNNHQLGTILMQENPMELEAAVVRDRVKPIVYLGDTIQYNVAAYNVSDNDMLEDFLRKLPGWTIDNSGRIVAHGKVIEQITVNGRTFFMNDPVFVSQNLPANILKNIKLFEKQSEAARFTGVDDGKRTQTVDVTVKEDMLKGWLGNLSAGKGTEKRDKHKGFIARFDKYNQVALVGNYSNVPDRFTSSSDHPESLKWDFGVNSNLSNKKSNLEGDISYRYRGVDNVQERDLFRENFLADSSFTNHSLAKNRAESRGHYLESVIKRRGEKTQLIVKAAANFHNSINSRSDSYQIYGGESGLLLLEGESKDSRKSDNRNFSTSLQLNRRTSKRNRSLGMDGSFSYSDSRGDGELKREGEYSQTYSLDSDIVKLSGGLRYTEPLVGRVYLSANYRVASHFGNRERRSYLMDGGTPSGTFLPNLSDKSKNLEFNQEAALHIQKSRGRGERLAIKGGVTFKPTYLRRSADGEDFDRWFTNLSPDLQLQYYSKSNLHITANYRGTTTNPTLDMIAPLPDNSDPLYFRVGNSDLKSQYEHSGRVNFRILNFSDVNQARSYGLLLAVNGSLFNNRVINRWWIDENGVQYSMPVNESGDYFLSSNLAVELPLFKGRGTIGNSLSAGLYNNNSYVNDKRSVTSRTVYGNLFQFNLELGELSLGSSLSFNLEQAENSLSQGERNDTWRNSVSARVGYHFPLGIEMRNWLSYQWFKGYRGVDDKPYLLWNIDITKSIVRNRLAFTISIRDLLNQNKSINYLVSDFYIQETRNVVTHQYFLFSLSYRFFAGGSGAAFRSRVNTLFRTNQPKEY